MNFPDAAQQHALRALLAEQEELTSSIAAGMLASSSVERDAYQAAYGAYLVIEAGRIQAGLQEGTPADAMRRAQERTHELMLSLGATLEEDMGELEP